MRDLLSDRSSAAYPIHTPGRGTIMWLALCRTYPNASLAVRLLKQIGGKHPDLILQGMGGGVEAASAFQAELRRSGPETALDGAEQVISFS